jgi:RNA polymerase sigma factor (sigma-70 family)
MSRFAESEATGGVPPQPGSAATSGADAEFAMFFASHHTRLFRAMYLVTGSEQEAEELMQEAFLSVWERWERLSAQDPVGYLYRTAMNAFRSRYRRLARGLRLSAAPVREDQNAEPQATVDDRDRVVRALRGLPGQQRQAIVLTEMVGLSSAEAGAAMGVADGTVRSLAHQARTALRQTLGDVDA